MSAPTTRGYGPWNVFASALYSGAGSVRSCRHVSSSRGVFHWPVRAKHHELRGSLVGSHHVQSMPWSSYGDSIRDRARAQLSSAWRGASGSGQGVNWLGGADAGTPDRVRHTTPLAVARARHLPLMYNYHRERRVYCIQRERAPARRGRCAPRRGMVHDMCYRKYSGNCRQCQRGHRAIGQKQARRTFPPAFCAA